MTFSIALQLFSVRQSLEESIDDAFAEVLDAGYRYVEGYSLGEHASSYADALARYDLMMPSCHGSFILKDEREQLDLFSAARELGVRTLIESRIPAEMFSDADGIADAAGRLNLAQERAIEYGLRLGHHSANYQFESRIDGDFAEVAFAKLLNPDLVIEVDTYWAKVAGADPVDVVADLRYRAKLLHLQDGAGIWGENQVAIGAGSMPIARVIEAATELEFAVVEFTDFPEDRDLFAAAASSRQFLVGLGGQS